MGSGFEIAAMSISLFAIQYRQTNLDLASVATPNRGCLPVLPKSFAMLLTLTVQFS